MISVTEKAVVQVKSIIDQEEKGGFHLRLGINGASCSGFQYFLGLDTEVRETDITVEFAGFKLLIDQNSAQYMRGSTLDYSDEPNNVGFVFNNPNAPQKPSECGSSCCC